MSFGNRLYELRKSKNVSLEELAELLDVSRQSISKWENDKAYPEMTRLLFMSDYFGVSLDYLMRGTENVANAENKEKTSVTYQTRNLLTVWNNFISNLSGRQRKLMMLLYVLVIAALIAILYSFCYGAGYVIGKLIANIQNSLHG